MHWPLADSSPSNRQPAPAGPARRAPLVLTCGGALFASWSTVSSCMTVYVDQSGVSALPSCGLTHNVRMPIPSALTMRSSLWSQPVR